MTYNNWFTKINGSSITSIFELFPSSFYSELYSRSRDISLSLLNPSYTTYFKTPSFSQPFLCSHSTLTSSKTSFRTPIRYDYILSTVTNNSESRFTKLSPALYLKNTESTLTRDFDNSLPNYPNVEVYCYLVDSNSSVKYLIPSKNKGILSSTYSNSSTKTLISSSWGLILACSLNKPELVVSQLIELLQISSSKSLITFQENRFRFSPPISSGLSSLDPSDTSSDFSFYENALLGLSISKALHYLTNINYFSNLISNFYVDCLNLCKAFCYITCNSFDYSTGFCCENYTNGEVDLFSTSFKTSVIASLLFNYYLQLDYDSTIHEKAARLFVSFNNLPELPDNLFYSLFTESSSLTICTYKFWWHCQFSPTTSLSLISFYSKNRLNSTTYSDDDFLIASLINLYSFNNRPSWTVQLLETFYKQSIFNEVTSQPIYNIVPLSCFHFKSDLVTPSAFDTFALEAEAFCSYSKDLIISFLPEGVEWSNPDKEEDKSTSIGSLIYTYSQCYFNFFIVYSLLRLPIFYSSGFLLRILINLWLPIANFLPEYIIKPIINTLLDPFIKEFIQFPLTSSHQDFLLNKLNFLLKQNFSVQYNSTPYYLSLKDLNSSTYSDKSIYTGLVNRLDYRNKVLYEDQYTAIAFYPKENTITTDSITKKYNSLAERTTPGFPVDSNSTGTVFSNDKYVYPVSEFLPLMPLHSNTYCPTGYTFITNLIMPVGVWSPLYSNYNLSFKLNDLFICCLGPLNISSNIKVCKSSVCKITII